MSGRRRQGLSPSLFPFLAVLVCTLGTLILFLALVAQNANDAAEQQKDNQAAKLAASKEAAPMLAADAAASMIEEGNFRVAELVSFRDAQTADIAQRKDQLTHLEDHVGRLREKLKQLSDEVEMATGTKPVHAVDQEKIAALHRQINEETTELEKLREEKSGEMPRVVIVPHKGPNGTDRRPIYIECDPKGVVIQPEGTRISLQELRDSDSSANPLDAALRIIRYHALNQYRDPVAPYPLLVVRPGGIISYNAAVYAMRDWDDQFGYELVSADVNLAFNKPDPELRHRLDLAVREAALHQRAKHAIAGIPSNGQGGLSSSGRRYPTLSAKSMGREGTANGFRSSDDSIFQKSPYTSGSYGAAGASESAASQRLDDHLRSTIEEMKNDGTGVEGANSSALPSQPRINQFAQEESTLSSERIGPYSSLESSDANPDATGLDTDAGKQGMTANEKVASILRGEKESEMSTEAKSSGNSDAASHQPTNGDSQSASATRPGMQAASSLDSKENQGQPPQAAMANNRDPGSLVKREGANWALPRSVAISHGNAIVRGIRVRCYGDRIVLMPSRAETNMEVFDVSDGDITRATLELATAVRDRIDRWGAAIPGGRWQPRLDVEVMSDGETRYHQLRTLMNGSGVEVQGRASQ